MKRDRRRSPLALGADPALRADAAWREATREARAAAARSPAAAFGAAAAARP